MPSLNLLPVKTSHCSILKLTDWGFMADVGWPLFKLNPSVLNHLPCAMIAVEKPQLIFYFITSHKSVKIFKLVKLSKSKIIKCKSEE